MLFSISYLDEKFNFVTIESWNGELEQGVVEVVHSKDARPEIRFNKLEMVAHQVTWQSHEGFVLALFFLWLELNDHFVIAIVKPQNIVWVILLPFWGKLDNSEEWSRMVLSFPIDWISVDCCVTGFSFLHWGEHKYYGSRFVNFEADCDVIRTLTRLRVDFHSNLISIIPECCCFVAASLVLVFV